MTISLRIILGAFICAITIVVALIAFLPTYFAGVAAVDSSIEDLRGSYVDRSEQSVDSFLELPLVRLRQAATFFESGLQNSTYADADSFDRYVVKLVWRERNIFSSVLLFLREGVAPAPGSRSIFCDVSVAPDYPILSTDKDHNATHRVSYVRAVDPTTLQELPSFINSNLTGRWATRSTDYFGSGEMYEQQPEYAAAISPRVGFQGVRPFADQPLLAAVAELTNPLQNNEVIGLVTINSKLERMQRLTRNLGLRQRSRACAFMIHPEPIVLGVSWDEETFEVVGNPFDFTQRFNSVRIKWFNNLTQGGYFLSEVVPTLGLNFLTDRTFSNHSSTMTTKEHGKTYIDIVTVKKVNLDVRVLLAMPESDFMDGISKARAAALAGTFSAIFLTFILAVIFANVITHPLIKLQDRMALAARFEDSAADDDGSESCMREVACMQRSYRNMRNELQRAKAYLPQSILDLSKVDDDESIVSKKGRGGGVMGFAEDDDEGEIIDDHQSRASSQGVGRKNHHARRGGGESTDDCVSTTKSSRRYDITGRSVKSIRSSRRGAFSSASPVPPVGGLNFSTTCSNKRVSILIFNMRQFTMCTSPNGLSSIQEKQLESVSKYVTEMKGNVDLFQGDFIQCSFNASKNCAQHLRNSLIAALAIMDDLSPTPASPSSPSNHTTVIEDNETVKKESGFPLCTVGMSSSMATVGNMGTNEMRRFCIVGQAVQQAILLERMNKVYGTKILAPDSTLTEVQSEFIARGVDILRLPRATAGGKSSRRTAVPSFVVEVLERANKGGEADEWMYELEQGAANNPFGKINAAFRFLMEGELKQADDELKKMSSGASFCATQKEEVNSKADDGMECSDRSATSHHSSSTAAAKNTNHNFHSPLAELMSTSETKCREILDRMEADPSHATLYPEAGWLERALLGEEQ